MGNKKKTGRTKMWKLAGEPVYPSPLFPAEEDILSGIFFWNELFSIDAPAIFEVPASLMNTRQSAARASLEFFFQQFGEKYQREDIVEALTTAATVPTTLAEQLADEKSFLLGAALWLLDYVRVHDLEDELEPLLPSEPDDDIIFRVPSVDDFTHSWADILRLMSVFSGRNGKHRKAFRSILSLLDKETCTHLRNSFKEVALDYFDRLMQVCTRVKKSAGQTAPPPPINVLAKPSLDSLLNDGPPPFLSAEDSPDILFLMQTVILVGAPMDKIQETLHSRRSAELMAGFAVRDPYVICMAYLLLEREGDALASLNMLTGGVIACADRHLPWAFGVPLSYAAAGEVGGQDYTLRYPFCETTDGEEEDDLPSIDIDAGQRCSESQLFYLATGYALPRDNVPSSRLAEWFVKQGLSEDRARELAWGAMIASYLDAWRDREFWSREFSWEDLEDESEPEPKTVPEMPQEKETEDPAQVEELTRQIKELRRALHDTERAAKQLQDRLLQAERQAASDREELNQLRSTLYVIRNEEDEPASGVVEGGIELPCKIQRRVLAFGGHDTWRKAIRPLLPDVRFFDTDMLPDISALKMADVIWVQTNAMSHKFYYRIIDTARKNGIPVRYFGFASARKCAEQLVADERSAKK